jgi:transcriptional regulator with XRE-family HTH domain
LTRLLRLTYAVGMTRKTHPKQFKTVAEALEGLGLTHQAAADIAGVDRTWITRLSHGMKLKALNTPLRISKALKVPIEALADDDAA